MRSRLLSLSLTLGLAVVGVPASQAWSGTADTASHLASTWDAPRGGVRIFDTSAVSATVTTDVERKSTDNAVCDLFVTTYTIDWRARAGHLLTAVVTEDDDYGMSWRGLNTTSWTMSPEGVVFDETSPVIQNWYLAGTHRSNPNVCPRDSRTVNHVEIYVDGPPRHPMTRPIIRPPAKSRLSAVWTWPDQVLLRDPDAVAVTQSFYYEVEDADGPCEARMTELDLGITAKGGERIVAVGLRAPGERIQYHNGDSANLSLGIVAHEWVLKETGVKSSLCPDDTYSQDRVEVYTR